MIYDYNSYFIQECLMPLGVLTFSSVCGITSVVYTLQILFHKRPIPTEWNDRFRMSLHFLMLAVFVFLIVISVIELSRGGFFLLTEKPQHSVEITARIEGCVKNEFPFGGKYGEEGSYYGAGLILEGQTFWVTTYKDLKAGDMIRAYVLPKSRFILQWERMTDERE